MLSLDEIFEPLPLGARAQDDRPAEFRVAAPCAERLGAGVAAAVTTPRSAVSPGVIPACPGDDRSVFEGRSVLAFRGDLELDKARLTA